MTYHSLLHRIGGLALGIALTLVATIAAGATATTQRDSLPALTPANAPKTLAQLWAGYDPMREPLHVQVEKQWTQDGIVCRIVRYEVGVFKGKPAMMAAIYGYPKGEQHLPGLVQCHGGGQAANLNAVLANAERGYACISLNWDGNQMGLNNVAYHGPNTDWGAVNPTQNGKYGNYFYSNKPNPMTIDSFKSPRNDAWFLLFIAARRALTFLQHQPQVNPDKLGIYGHSMGAVISLAVAAVDSRVKACVPTSGAAPGCMYGIFPGGRKRSSVGRTFGVAAYARLVKCPLMLVSPANDFYGTPLGVRRTAELVHSRHLRFSREVHLNHRGRARNKVCVALWFDQYLKGTFKFPKTPAVKLQLTTTEHIPLMTVRPDASKPIESVRVWYTQDGRYTYPRSSNRFWRYARAVEKNGQWVAPLPLLNTGRPLWAYASVLYSLTQKGAVAAPTQFNGGGYVNLAAKPKARIIRYAGLYYQWFKTDHFSIGSPLLVVHSRQLKQAGDVATLHRLRLIESFKPGWRRQWYSWSAQYCDNAAPNPGNFQYITNKFNDAQWYAPAGAKLALMVGSQQPNSLILQFDAFTAKVVIKGGGHWQTVKLSPGDFRNGSGKPMHKWGRPTQFTMANDGTWKGELPEFRNLRWVTDNMSR
ncbi:MAG: hypothetical protein HKL95_09380 [Phycisphaerae bacterium]|nr:hypothetical protein [Phycisphaerae bacterium]